ncbi:MAG: efflux RND transporter periplasmic adaptor subunit [bacterium]|nr:efflux RND transporter periplasmic adaptor subunit [bacterium]
MKWFTRRRVLLFGVILLILLGGWWWRSSQARRTPVQTYSVVTGDVRSVIIASGEIKADKIATVRFPATGKLGYLNVTEGQLVKKGQSLAGMDATDLSSAETEAYYRYLAADANAKEVEDSVKGHDRDETYVQRNDRVAAQTARDIAYDNWREAQRDVRDALLFSPLAGIVTNISVSAVGATVTVTDGVTVVDPGGLYFALEVDEADIGQVQLDQAVEMTLDAYPDSPFTGHVGTIAFASSISDSGATVYKVRIKLDLADMAKLRLGMNGDAKITLEEAKGVLTLPLETVVDGRVKSQDGQIRQIETGIEGEDTVEIKSGLSQGDQVVAQ